jgi:hypothetical protein
LKEEIAVLFCKRRFIFSGILKVSTSGYAEERRDAKALEKGS